MIQQNFIQLYEKSFHKNWALQALSDYKGISYTYGEVARQVARLHLMYEAMGIRKGDKIAVFGKKFCQLVHFIYKCIYLWSGSCPHFVRFQTG